MCFRGWHIKTYGAKKPRTRETGIHHPTSTTLCNVAFFVIYSKVADLYRCSNLVNHVIACLEYIVVDCMLINLPIA